MALPEQGRAAADVARRGGVESGAAHHCGSKLAATAASETESQVAYGPEWVMSTRVEIRVTVERSIAESLVVISSLRAVHTDRRPHSNAIATLAVRLDLKSNDTMRETACGQYGTDVCDMGESSTDGALVARDAGSVSAEDCYSRARLVRLPLRGD